MPYDARDTAIIVTSLQVHADAVESVGSQRAVRASRFRARFKHEVIDDKLTSPVKKLRECLFPVRSFKHILFPDRLPRQLAPLLVELVLQPRELLLLRQKRCARCEPLLVRDYLVIFDTAAVVFHELTSSRNANHTTTS